MAKDRREVRAAAVAAAGSLSNADGTRIRGMEAPGRQDPAAGRHPEINMTGPGDTNREVAVAGILDRGLDHIHLKGIVLCRDVLPSQGHQRISTACLRWPRRLQVLVYR